MRDKKNFRTSEWEDPSQGSSDFRAGRRKPGRAYARYRGTNPAFYAKKGEPADTLVARAVLAEIGVEVSRLKKPSDEIAVLLVNFSECFEPQMRDLVIDAPRPSLIPTQEPEGQVSREESFLHGAEEMPGWAEGINSCEPSFDFGVPVNPSRTLYREKDSVKGREDPAADVDKSIAKFSEESLLNRSMSSIGSKSWAESSYRRSNDSDEEHYDAKEYFEKLKEEIQQMLKETPHEEDTVKPKPDKPSTVGQAGLKPAPWVETKFVETENYRKVVGSLPADVAAKECSFLKITANHKQARKKRFQSLYGYLDEVMTKLVYDFLNSKHRGKLASLNHHPFNQVNVEKYCRNPYKIFSLYLQGNIMQKLWRVKEAEGEDRGPYTAFDMDIWGADPRFFSANMEISFDETPFIPWQVFFDRHPLAEWLVSLFLSKQDGVPPLMDQSAPPMRRDPQRKVNFYQKPQNIPYEKKPSFRKKVENVTSKPDIWSLQTATSSAPSPDAENFPSISPGIPDCMKYITAASAWGDE